MTIFPKLTFMKDTIVLRSSQFNLHYNSWFSERGFLVSDATQQLEQNMFFQFHKTWNQPELS